jgi:succinoglycan biosynthesis protein ExoU
MAIPAGSKPEAPVCVIIAAMNASATIARAVRSALDEPEVGEVIVVDDGSSDATAAVATSADDGSGRLKVITLPENAGPSYARNRALEASSAGFVAILDADDFILPGRFQRLLRQSADWDFIADNILLIDAAQADAPLDVADIAEDAYTLTTLQFIMGNISQPGVERAEIGFLKPVMKRAFLDRHGLRYDETMRLGEDYDLYLRALASGARYRVVHTCGYGATVRANSLSGRHRTVDLKMLYEADQRIGAEFELTAEERRALSRHEAQIRRRHDLRAFLDRKKEIGLRASVAQLLRHPRTLRHVVTDVLRDKRRARLSRSNAKTPAILPRYLLPARNADEE